MIAILCAMKQEKDAFVSLMKDVKVAKLESLVYHGEDFDNEYYKGKLADKDVVICRCGVGKVYAAILTTLIIKKFKPELVINVGCAGSLNENIHVGDVVVATRVADWEMDVPGWKRSIDSNILAFTCDNKFSRLVKDIKMDFNVNCGYVVSGDEFIYKKPQVKTIKKYFPDALCGEMEGASIACTCNASSINCEIIRSISDETLVNGNYKAFEFNLDLACDNAAKLCEEIIKRY